MREGRGGKEGTIERRTRRRNRENERLAPLLGRGGFEYRVIKDIGNIQYLAKSLFMRCTVVYLAQD